MRFPLETILTINALLLLLTVVAVFLLARDSVKFRRNTGNVPAQQRWQKKILRLLLFLLMVGTIGSAFNLFSV